MFEKCKIEGSAIDPPAAAVATHARPFPYQQPLCGPGSPGKPSLADVLRQPGALPGPRSICSSEQASISLPARHHELGGGGEGEGEARICASVELLKCALPEPVGLA